MDWLLQEVHEGRKKTCCPQVKQADTSPDAANPMLHVYPALPTHAALDPARPTPPLRYNTFDTIRTNRRSSTPLLRSGSLLRISSPRSPSSSAFKPSSLQWMKT